MTITLRKLEDGAPVGAGDIVRTVQGQHRFEVDNWSEGTCKVYARPPGHTPKAPLREFNPSELGLYIGHERFQGRPARSSGARPSRARCTCL